MIGKRLLGVAGAGVLVSFLGILAACSGADQGKADAAETLRSANVALTLFDANGTAVGEGAGVLIAPRVVLTSAHLVAGKAKWQIRTADGKTATGVRGLTKDWRVYDSMKAHPRKNDVAVIYLDKAIDLPAYPKLASSKATGDAMRVRKTETGFVNTSAKLERLRSFPNAYVTGIPTNETLVTGNAVVNENFEIVGLVTGRGLTTSKLYVARTDKLLAWLSPKVACGGGPKVAATNLATRTYGTPPPKPGCDAGSGDTTSGSSSGGSSSGGSSSGDTTSGSSSGGSSSGGSSGEGSSGSSGSGGADSCNDGGGLCSGSCDTGSDSNGGSSSGGSSSGGSSGADTTTSSSSGGTTSGSSSGGSSSGDTTSGSSSGGSSGADTTTSGSSSGGTTSGSSSGDTTSGSSSGGSSSGDTTSGSSSGGSSGADTNTSSSSSGGTGGGDDTPVCTGSDDNPEVCPPEETGCSGPNCGGGSPDDLIDYGKCACSVPVSNGGPVILR